MGDGSGMFPVRRTSGAQVESEKVLALRQRRVAPESTCEHEWKTFKQTIEPFRTAVQEAKGQFYERGRAYFIVNGCEKCHIKRNINMRIEP